MAVFDTSTFDFWIGEWDCDFEGGHAINTVSREFGGRVLVERFEADLPQRWSGTSMSVFAEHDARWRQTWVDESGSYWAFAGTLVDGDPSFATPARVDAEQVFKRMVFSDIADDSFHWRWESSPDGNAWTINWEIDYRRRQGSIAGR
jgi:hypothetical protein